MTRSALADALGHALDTDPGRPLVTYYDDSTSERVELSVATMANWVAKTANLVVDGLGLGPGDSARVDLPRHWQLPVWVMGAWTAGVRVDLGAADGRAQLVVCGPQGPGAAPAADEVVALSLRPMGAPFEPGTLPGGAMDYGREVAAYGDRFAGPGLAARDPALTAASTVWTLPEAFEQAGALAASWGLASGGRLLVAAELAAPLEVLACTLVPLSVGASVVLWRIPAGRGADPEHQRLAAVAAAERTTAVAAQ